MVLANAISDLVLASPVREMQAAVMDLFQRTAERVVSILGIVEVCLSSYLVFLLLHRKC